MRQTLVLTNWLNDQEGNPIIGWGEDTNGDGKIDQNDTILHFLIDLTNAEVADFSINRAILRPVLPRTRSLRGDCRRAQK